MRFGWTIVYVPDVAEAVAAGAVAVAPPAHKPWGQTVSYVRDLSGVLVELAPEVD